ncbi:MAG: TniQ family protein [Anaerolineae bacterium]|nr:TniQ family protein [Anaerolineae bacterium]
MIGHFPHPYPEELFYSVCARYSEQMQYPTKIAVCDALFGVPNLNVIADFPTRLKPFSRNLLPGHTLKDMRQIVRYHSQFPYYAPFLPVRRRVPILSIMHVGPKSGSRLLGSRIPRLNRLKFCPECVNADRIDYGECFWRRVHQIPGIKICPTHKIPLYESWSQDLRNYRNEFISAEQAVGGHCFEEIQIDIRHYEIHLSIACSADWLLKNPGLNINPDVIQRKYHELQDKRGLYKYAGNTKKQKFEKDFIEMFPPELLASIGSDLGDDMHGNWLKRIIRTKGSFTDPIRHLLLIHCFGHTAESFFLSCQTDPSWSPIRRTKVQQSKFSLYKMAT